MELSPALARPLFDATSDVILLVSIDGQILSANTTAQRLVGEKIEGLALVDLIPGEQLSSWSSLLEKAEGSPEGSAVELELRGVGGVRVPLSVRVTCPFDGTGPRLVIARDLSQLRALQRQLATAQIQISEDKEHLVLAALAGTAAHELNQPLTAILGYAEMMRRKLSDTDPMSARLDLILEATERMADLVKKLGRVSRFETKLYGEGRAIVDLDRADRGK